MPTNLTRRLEELEKGLDAHRGRTASVEIANGLYDTARDALTLARELCDRLAEVDQHRCYDPNCGRICPKCRVVHHPDTRLPETLPGSRFSLPKCPECGALVYWLCALRAKEADAALARLAEVERGNVELQRHRDAWRSYAYGRRERPQDFLDGNMVESDRGPTEVLRLRGALEALLNYTTQLELLTYAGSERDQHHASVAAARDALSASNASAALGEAMRDLALAVQEALAMGFVEEDFVRESLEERLARLTALVPGLGSKL